ncbi:MAG TPA: phosphatidate cytidylyltransferase [Chthoniobacteraceae bacterium]|nr:phosphatidate cytidylyltransferase [Chthoniobacteraceae bacterium]
MNSVFLSRLASTVVLWTVVCWVVFTANETGLFAFVGIMALVALAEFYRMLAAGGQPHFRLTGLLCGAGLLLYTGYALKSGGGAKAGDVEGVALAAVVVAILLRQLFRSPITPDAIPAVGNTLLGIGYVVVLFHFMNKIIYLTPLSESGMVTGQFYLLYLMVVTKFSDMGAYLTGTAIGRHPAIPHVSPNKTWEGFGGALVFSTLGSLGLLWLMASRLPLLNVSHAIALGLLLGFAAIIGDLVESVFKRSAGVKDSGRFLPGIGGALDLIDSLLFTAPLLFVYLYWLEQF